MIVSSAKAYYLSKSESESESDDDDEPRVMDRCMLYFQTLFHDKRDNSIGSAFYYVIYMVRRALIVSIALWM